MPCMFMFSNYSLLCEVIEYQKYEIISNESSSRIMQWKWRMRSMSCVPYEHQCYLRDLKKDWIRKIDHSMILSRLMYCMYAQST